MFKQLDSMLDLPILEHEMLRFWKRNGIFDKRRKMNEGKPSWTFIDGPITANNPMGVHHAWGRTYKDLWQRYKAMKGFDELYQNGFDCQGLWVEVEVEKELGFESKRDIAAYGIAEFVIRCKQRVLRYAATQTEQSIRLGMWMDWDDPHELRKLAKALENPMEETTYISPKGPVTGTAESLVGKLGSLDLGGSYFTLSDENNFMIWAALKSCHKRGWIYKGEDSMPWCPRCSTGISQHEIVTEGYKELTHTSLYVKFPLREKEGALLIWTTTPWTLTSNVAVAVHPELDYAKVRYGGEVFYLSKGTFAFVFPDGGYEVLEDLKGIELDGWAYDGPFDEMGTPRKLGAPEAHRVIFWDGVGESEGTGIVHIAPGAGREDLELGRENNLPAVAPLDEFGVFIEGFGWLTGTHVYDSTGPISNDLKEKGLLFRIEDYTHRYPVCWRCDSELIFRLVEEWFISMGDKLDKPYNEVTPQEKYKNLRYQIMDSAMQVKWIPEFGLMRELDWLKNMNDWMISKKRFWGLALPIWECECGWFDVLGSKEELMKRAVEGWEEFKGRSPHRPYIDAVKIKCEKCGKIAARIPDVGNPWLDAGIVAYSTLCYRTDRAYWGKWFPAEFITECYPGQFRNWFYSMLAMSTILERRTPFEVCLGHGIVLAEDGREMHKSWGNAINVDDAVEVIGADVMRWMYCTSKPENNMLFGYTRAAEAKRDFILPFINLHNFFAIYAELDGWTVDQEPRQLSLLDKWALSQLNRLVGTVTGALDEYDANTAIMEIKRFMDVLSRWYVRRSRRRFWKSEADEDKQAGYSVLYTCLKTLILLLAPFTPFVTETVYQGLVKQAEPYAPQSVHLEVWPEAQLHLIDEDLMDNMELAMKVSRLGRAARGKNGIKLRQPLQEVIIFSKKPTLNKLEDLVDLIREELNVKEVRLTEERTALLRQEVKPLSHILGKKYGKAYAQVIKEVRMLDDEKISQLAEGKVVQIMVDGVYQNLLPKEVEVMSIPLQNYSVMEEAELIVGVKTDLTEVLRYEGLARDIVRRIQALRKEAGFEIDDHIKTYYTGDPLIERVFEEEAEYISEETLSDSLYQGEASEEVYERSFMIEGLSLDLGLVRVKN